MHQSIVTMPTPNPRGQGGGIAGKMLHRPCNTWVLFFRKKMGGLQLHMVKHSRLRRQLAVVLPTVGPHNGAYSRNFLDKMSPPPPIPQWRGGGCVVTNDWCIKLLWFYHSHFANLQFSKL